MHDMRTTTITACDTLTDGISTTCNKSVTEMVHLVSSSSVTHPLLFVLPRYLFNFHKKNHGEQETVNAVFRPRILYNSHITLFTLTHHMSLHCTTHLIGINTFLWEHSFRLILYTQLSENTSPTSAYPTACTHTLTLTIVGVPFSFIIVPS